MVSQNLLSLGFCGIRSHHRIKSNGATEDRAVLRVGLDTRTVDTRVTDIHTGLQFVEEFTVFCLEDSIGRVRTEAPALIVRTVEVTTNDTFLIEVTQRQEIVTFIITTTDTQLMLNNRSIVVEHLILPVGTITLIAGNLISRVSWCITIVDLHLVHDCHILLGIQDRLLLPGILPTIAEVIVDRGLTGNTGLSSYQNHTIGSTRTIDGCRGSILQDLNRGDIHGVQVADTTLNSHTINDIKRV